jgi:hypothetical protein
MKTFLKLNFLAILVIVMNACADEAVEKDPLQLSFDVTSSDQLRW